MSRRLAQGLTGLATGTLFGVGLGVAQMSNPEKILSFLDVFGHWDPSLLLVMAAAVTVTFLGYRWIMPNEPLFETAHALPTSTQIDTRLIIGAVLFGLGWGAAGYCPGPAITALGSGSPEPFVFLAALLVGSQAARMVSA